MSGPLKLTLDTNSVINALDTTSSSATSVEEIRQLIALGLENKVNIAVTTRLASDIEQDTDPERRREMLERIAMFPVVGSIARLDVTRLDSGDVLVGDDEVRLVDEIAYIVFPTGIHEGDKHFSNKTNDVDHLVGHLLNDRDVFVTDDRGILRRHDQLKQALGLIVLRPAEALAYVDRLLRRKGPAALTSRSADAYRSRAHFGSVSFDYSNNDGTFVLADGVYLVGTKWSKASDVSIHAYSDHESVSGVALAKGAHDIGDVTNAASYDFSSRSRTVGEEQVVVFRNVNDVYAVIKVREVEDDTRRAAEDQINFDYSIGEIGQINFASARASR